MFGFDKLPDNTNKIYLVLSVVAFYFVALAFKSEQDKLDASYIEYERITDEETTSNIEVSDKLIRLARTSEYISKKYKIENPVTFTDTTASLNITKDTSKDYLASIDIILPIYLDFTTSYVKDKIHKVVYKGAGKKYELARSTYNKKTLNYGILCLMILIVFITSIWSLRKRENEFEYQEEFKRFMEKYNLREKGTLKETCQSCGRIFDSIVTVSKNTDNTYNYAFCSDCYSNGNFVLSFEDVKQKIQINESISDDQKRIYVEKLNSLDRWKENRYEI